VFVSIDPNNLAGTSHLTFDDEFNNLSLWNGSSGTWATSFWYQDPTGSNGASLPSNAEEEWYINSNYGPTQGVTPWTASNGVLTITATPTPSWLSGYVNNYSYVSGEINTYHSFQQTYGYFEMRAQLPAGQGFWPAFWLMPEDGSWPPELDVVEALGQNPTELVTTSHSAYAGMESLWTQVPNMTTGYHTYGMDWEPDYITWYFDGQAVYQIPTPADMNKAMYIIANLAVGGNWPGPADGSSSAQLNIDYIRAYAPGGTGASTGSSSPVSSGSSSSAPTSGGSAAAPLAGGQTFTSDDHGDQWVGTSGNDVFNLGRGGDYVTGNGGADTFKFAQIPWAGGHITDFSASDMLDLSGMFASVGYSGSNPVADGRLAFVSDGQGGTQIWFDADGLPIGSGGTWLVTTLDHVAPSSLSISNGLISEAGSSISYATVGPTTGSAASGSAGSGSAGQTFTSDNNGDHWAGTSGNDTFNLGRGGDYVVGNGGADTFKFAEVPWARAEIADFSASDTIDLTAMFQRYGYSGTDPVSDGRLSIVSDGAGGSQIWFDMDGLPVGTGGTWQLLQLDHFAPSNLHVNGAFVSG
jgi:beta-glucanase (GH16 family)